MVTAEPAIDGAFHRIDAEGTYAAYMAANNALRALPADRRQPVQRVGVLRNFTVEPVLPVLAVEMAREGMHPELYVGDFDAIAADALNPHGPLAQFDPHVVIVALWLEGLSPGLPAEFTALAASALEAEVERVAGYLRDMLEGIRRFSAAPVLVNNFVLPSRPALGILDAQRANSQAEAVLGLNRRLREMAAAMPNVFVVDYLGLFANIGIAEGFDAHNWVHRRSPIGRRALIPVGREYGKYLRALKGRARKCVVVDCDNTLWGGIVGEDGLDGIKLDGTPRGARHVALQRELVSLYRRGVMVALCSKNNEADVLEVLRGHPGMVLREEHIATHRVNWEDKASNIRSIAKELNIGLDSIVFVDDSAFECGLVREQVPEVTVIQLEPDGTDYVAALSARGLFDSLVSSAEDAQRTAHFKAEAERRQLQGSASSLEEYLAGLGMVAEVGAAHDEVIPRIAQLTQKTNQFNTTTKRYTEADVRAMAAAADTDVLYLRLRDKVADLGIVGVAIVRARDGVAEVDSLLMSCRALGRGVETVLLGAVRDSASRLGCDRIRGIYVPTAKNAQVAGFFPSAGFVEDDGSSPPTFTAAVSSVADPHDAIQIVLHPTLQR